MINLNIIYMYLIFISQLTLYIQDRPITRNFRNHPRAGDRSSQRAAISKWRLDGQSALACLEDGGGFHDIFITTPCLAFLQVSPLLLLTHIAFSLTLLKVSSLLLFSLIVLFSAQYNCNHIFPIGTMKYNT